MGADKELFYAEGWKTHDFYDSLTFLPQDYPINKKKWTEWDDGLISQITYFCSG